MSNEIPIISLVRKGSRRYPRYILAKADPYKNPLFWNSLNWTANESDAVLFSDVTQALWTYHDLILDAVGDRPCHRYVAPLYIEIYGEKPKLADLRAWLERAVRIVVDSPKHGIGPDDTVGIIVADFERTADHLDESCGG